MARRSPGLVVGLAVGALLAFPAGLMLGRSGEQSQVNAPPARSGNATGMRDPYSPRIFDDPAFRAAQHENLELLDRQCAATGAYCAEAEALRRSLEPE